MNHIAKKQLILLNEFTGGLTPTGWHACLAGGHHPLSPPRPLNMLTCLEGGVVLLLGDVGLQKCGVENGKFGSVRRKVSLRKKGKFVLSSWVVVIIPKRPQHVQHQEGSKCRVMRSKIGTDGFYGGSRFSPREARFFMSCTQRSPSPSFHTKAFVRFDFEIGASEGNGRDGV